MCVCEDFVFNDTATTEIYTYLHTLSLHDALPIYDAGNAQPPVGEDELLPRRALHAADRGEAIGDHARRLEHLYRAGRSEEHTSELQSLMRISYAVFCLKKKKQISPHKYILPSPRTITIQTPHQNTLHH